MEWLTFLIIVGIVACVFGLVILGMAVGVIVSNRRIKGSCGGLANMREGDGNSPCMACGGSLSDCDEAARQENVDEKVEEIEEKVVR